MANNEVVHRPVANEAGLDLLACPFFASTNVSFYEHVYAQHFAVKCNLCGAEGPQRQSGGGGTLVEPADGGLGIRSGRP